MRLRRRFSCPLMVVTLLPAVLEAQRVSGRVSLTERGGQQAADISTSVVWLTGSLVRPAQASRGGGEMVTEGRQFRPRILVVSVGTVVAFPNHDPFKHNIFSTQPTQFDLGLFGRGEGPSQRLDRAGLVRLYCNIHPRMSGFLLVLSTGLWKQPGSDGSFEFESVPPGRYQLHAWHERAGGGEEKVIDLVVPAAGLSGVQVPLDASGYRFVQHLNKYGRPYGTARERY